MPNAKMLSSVVLDDIASLISATESTGAMPEKNTISMAADIKKKKEKKITERVEDFH